MSQQPARACSPGPPPRWAHAGPTPEKFTWTDEDGSRHEVWAKDGKADGLAVVWNKAGLKVKGGTV